MTKVIGIDLGTSNSCVSVMELGIPKIVENEQGYRTTPSVVGFRINNVLDVGHQAKNRAKLNPENTFFAVKRLIGRRFSDPIVKDSMMHVPYSIVEAENGDAWVSSDGKDYSPSQIASHILRIMKVAAENSLHDNVNQAVITVPAYFNNAQRQATKDAGRIAGLEVLRIINEPTAAALAYGFNKTEDKNVIVYDLGGGTFDISILEISNGEFRIKSTNGDTFLGGEDFDIRLVDYFADEFMNEHGIDLRRDKTAVQRLKNAAEKAKIELSTLKETEVIESYISADSDGPKHLNLKLTRQNLEQLVEDIIERTISPCRIAMKDANLSKEEIDEVILVGGMTRMPRIQEITHDLFGKKPNKSVNPDEVVALGAAIQAGMLQGEVKDLVLSDVNPLSLGIRITEGRFSKIIEKNSTIPTKKSQNYTNSEDYQTNVSIRVYQGESEYVKNNMFLGGFFLKIPPRLRGMAKIRVTFDHDLDGIVFVTAKDMDTGEEQEITIQKEGGLADDEIEKLVNEIEFM